ncbi:hypothetical protein SAMN04488483_5849 [Pseudomonas helmanticensis]|uniref:Uncharacterized protein n=1 Tax=Pseudomonas helmanticensis TaxID=1471381 RepID=A0ACD2UEI1_9PSED|nr:hypothetical protein SAMN04488483_5849 [Pseudomonas helmanticensis]
MYKYLFGEDPFPPDVERQAHAIGSETARSSVPKQSQQVVTDA